jgi:biotin carboxyl carrier protein
MSEIFKISGKKVSIPSETQSTWKFTERPGGWIIAESSSGIRKRFLCSESQGNFSAAVNGCLWFGQWVSQQRQLTGAASGGDSELVAQFPGKVRKILVKEGAEVNEGDALLLVEAMKMEFAIRAPFSGTVNRLLVKEGQQLSPGTQFLDLEASKSGK